MKKRLTALALSAVMAATLLAACGGNTAGTTTAKPADSGTTTQKPEESKPGETTAEVVETKPEEVTIKVYYARGEIPTDDNTLAAKMKEELGVTLEAEYLVGDEDERIGIMIAGGDYPDLMPFNQRVVDNGGARPLDDLLPQYENLDKHYGPHYNKMRSPQDGKLYYMPNFGIIYNDEVITEHWGTGVFLQKAVLEEFDYPLIKTLDEYFDLIERYAEKYPTIDGAPTIGYTILNDGWRNFGLVNPPQFLAGHPNNGNAVMDFETATGMDPSTTDIAKQYYQKLNEVNANGLFDQEAASMNYDQYIAKLSAGNVLGTMDQKWNMNSANTALVSAGKENRTYVSLPIVYDESITEYYRDQTVLNLSNGFMLTTTDDSKVDRIMTFLDDITTEEWTKNLSWGIEGEAYLVGDDGIFYRTEEQREEQRNSAWPLKHKLNAFLDYAPKLEGTFSDGNAYGPGNDYNEYYANLSDYDKTFLDAYGFKAFSEFYLNPPPNPVWYPTWQINIPDGSPESIANTKASDTKVQMLPAVITATPENFETKWAEFVTEYDKVNYGIVIDFINEEVQWRIDNWSAE
ncbi:MAG: sugar ABC transporter substrate-binding protein [Clostridiaceae bacterium]|nr:sugar ABC transporter substrate-binding protein [Clostridiaceae bacterium]